MNRHSVCIIGNSHIAAVKRAYAAYLRNSNSNQRVDFFGSTANSVCDTEMRDGKIVPTSELVQRSWKMTSGGLEAIDLEQYEKIVIHGYLPSVPILLDLKRSLDNGTFYSFGVKVSHIINSNVSLDHLLRLLAHASVTNICVSPRPPCYSTVKRSETVQEHEYYELISFITQVFLSLEIEFVPQPETTLNQFVETKREYSTGGVGLTSSPEPYGRTVTDDDIKHTNEVYGKIIMQKLGLVY